MKKFFVCFLAWFLLNLSPALAGEQVSVRCANPRCDYSRNLALGGARLSPAITCYCASCRDFVRVKLQDWDQYYDKQYKCPKCGREATPIYSQAEISKFPCPKCGKLTLKTKTLILFD
jgi:predicted RNA-binding Zn-ribbon protein involved in translation (DUF1610 family)